MTQPRAVRPTAALNPFFPRPGNFASCPQAGGRVRRSLTGACVAWVSVGPLCAAAGALFFDLPADRADRALKRFAASAGIEVVFSSEVATGVRANAVRGEFAPLDAAHQLLAGTVLGATQRGPGDVIVVTRRAPAPDALGLPPDKKSPPSVPSLSAPKPTTDSKQTVSEPTTMKSRFLSLLTGLVAVAGTPATAQTAITGAAEAPSRAALAQTVVLSPFEVRGKEPGRYQSTEATSGRVRVNVFDAPQNISIINRGLIEDVAAITVVEAAKYVAGVTLSSNTTTADRTTIRGFQVENTIVDGFQTLVSEGNLDTVVVERLEVVKGPSPILAKSGSPGGAINIVSRKPEFRDFGSVLVEVGGFDSNRAQLDVNRVFGTQRNFAYRLLGAHQETEGYWNNAYRQTTLMPMASWRAASGAQLTVQGHYTRWGSQNFQGVPIDPSSGTLTGARILDGIKRDLNTYGADRRREIRHELRAFLTVPLTDAFSFRLAGRYSQVDSNRTQNTGAPQGGGTGGARNPLTGVYEPGFVFGAAPTFTRAPANPQSRLFVRGSGSPTFNMDLFDVQADGNHVFKYADVLSATTTAGFSTTAAKISSKDFGSTSPVLNYDSPTGATYNPTATLRTNSTSNTTTQQLYIAESLEFWQGRVALSGNASYNNFDITLRDRRVGAANPSVIAGVDTTLINWGVVVKPIPSVSLYYSGYENATPSDAFDISTGLPPLKEGKTREFGVRYQGLGGRVYLTVGHFDTDQLGFSIFNPGNRAVPAPTPPLPNLVSDRNAKGWEYELRLNLTAEFSLIGNYADFTNRNPFGQALRNAAGRSGAVLGNYRFNKNSVLGGFSVGLSADWLDRRAGDDPTGFTNSVTPVPNQPTFFLPARTLVNLTLGYQAGERWSAQLNVENLLNKDYLASSSSRNLVWTGKPLNARVAVKYKF